jgi:hypothetical protein
VEAALSTGSRARVTRGLYWESRAKWIVPWSRFDKGTNQEEVCDEQEPSYRCVTMEMRLEFEWHGYHGSRNDSFSRIVRMIQPL